MIKSKRKLLLFDCWTKGLIHIHRLVSSLKKYDIEIVLLHTGSWGDERGRDAHEYIEGIEVFDISYFKSFDEALNIINPSGVLFLSMDTMLSRGFNRLSKSKGLKTILLYHGLHSVFHSLAADKKSFFNFLKYLFTRIKNGVLKNLAGYVKILFITSNSIKDYLLLVQDIFRKISGQDIKELRAEGSPDSICVFNYFDELHAQKKYPECKNIQQIGLADILKFPNLQDEVLKSSNLIKKKRFNQILYIGTGMRSTNMLSSNDIEYYDFLNEIRKALQGLGYEVKFKLHYSRIDKIISIANSRNESLSMVSDNVFIETISNSEACICEPSSASLIPGLLNKKIFFPLFSLYKDLKYGKALKTYPNRIYLNSIEELHKNILVNEEIDNTEIKKWHSNVLGPLPTHDLPNRFAQIADLSCKSAS